MRKWRTKIYNTSSMSLSQQREFVNKWLTDFENIFRDEAAKINVMAGYNGFISANAASDIASNIDDYLANYRQTVTALSNKDLIKARGARNGMAQAFKERGISNFFDELEVFDKEARALGLTLRERTNNFLNTLGRNETTIRTVSETGKVMRWRPDAYARMYANTRDSQLRDEIFQDQLVEIGSDIVQVSDHGTDTPICLQFEGKVYSLTGNTPAYPVLPQRPPFHPNCKHFLTSRPKMSTREGKRINFFKDKDISKQRQTWTASQKRQVKTQTAWNLKNRPPKGFAGTVPEVAQRELTFNNTRDAEVWAKNNITGVQSVNYKGLPLSEVTRVNNELLLLQNKYGKLGSIESIKVLKTKKFAARMNMGKHLEINENLTSASEARQVLSGISKGKPSIAGVIDHEIGHALTPPIFDVSGRRAVMTPFGKKLDSFFIKNRTRIAKEMTEYAAEARHEFVAEAFAMREANTAPKWVLEWLRSVNL